MAMAYLAEGYHAFVLRYTVGPESTWPVPLEDAEEAISMIRSKSDDWNVDAGKIAVIGFSAGGHLATTLSTHPEDVSDIGDSLDAYSFLPDIQILIGHFENIFIRVH